MRFETPEQRSKKLQQAQRELVAIQEAHAASLRDLRDHRRRMRQLMGPAVPNDASEKRKRQSAIQDCRQAIDAAIKARDDARAKLEGAKDAARAAESQACIQLIDSAKPDYCKQVSSYLREMLQRIEAEALPLLEAFSIREGMEIALGIQRSSKVHRLTATRSMIRRHEQLQQLREDVAELVEAGIISLKDVPKGLSKAWNLN